MFNLGFPVVFDDLPGLPVVVLKPGSHLRTKHKHKYEETMFTHVK